MNRCWLIIILIAFTGCKNEPVVLKVDEKNGETLYSVSGDNEAMNAAIEEAKRSYPLFERAMQQPDTSLSRFWVKMRFTNGDQEIEHLWVSNLHMIGGQLFGVLNSEPVYIKTLKLGDTLRVVRNDISDWMYLKNGKLQGGYTIKAIFNSLNEKEKKEFLESKSYKIE